MNCPLKALAHLVTVIEASTVRPYLALEHIESGTGKLVPGTTLEEREPTPSGMATIRPGDVLFGKLRPYLAKVCHANTDLLASTELMCLRPRAGVDSKWLYYACLAIPVIEWAVATAEGVKMPRTNWEKFREFRLGVPNPEEQRAIADFLDRETARIDALITKKHRLSAALSERWTTEVDNLFSCDPGLPFKRLLRRPLAYGVLVPVFVEGGVPMLRINDFAGGPPHLTSVARIDPFLSQEYRRTIVEEGDLVVSVVGTLGRSAEIDSRLVGCNLNRALARVQLRGEVPRSLIRHWFGSSQFQRDAQMATSSDSAQPTLGLGDLKNFRIRIPEDTSEWRELTKLLEEKEAFFDATQTRLATQIGLLVEHRQALITAAVIGQMDIPSAA